MHVLIQFHVGGSLTLQGVNEMITFLWGIEGLNCGGLTMYDVLLKLLQIIAWKYVYFVHL